MGSMLGGVCVGIGIPVRWGIAANGRIQMNARNKRRQPLKSEGIGLMGEQRGAAAASMRQSASDNSIVMSSGPVTK